jgi:hypothetical protein
MCSHTALRSVTVSSMKHVHAYSCRDHRYSEGLKGLLTSRGRAMAQTLDAQPFNWVMTSPAREVPSTA